MFRNRLASGPWNIVLLGLVLCDCSDAMGPTSIGPGRLGVLKITVDSLTLASPPAAAPSSWNAHQPQMILAARASGTLAAWNGKDGAVHVTSITPAKPDVVFAGTKLGGFALTATGFGFTAVQDPKLSVVGVNEDGSEAFRTLLIGGVPKEQKGSKFDPMNFGSSRLAFAGSTYVAYYAHQQNFGDATPDVHQGDMLVNLDAAGAKKTGGWDWGTSHSLDQRIIHDGQAFVTVSLGDCYPKGITFERVGVLRKVTLLAVDGDCGGKANGILGGVAKVSDIYAVAFGTPQGRSAQDAGVMFVNAQGKVRRTAWLTILSGGAKKSVTRVNTAAFGTDLLMAWIVNDQATKKDSTYIAVMDTTGKILLGPDNIDESFSYGDDFMNFPNGDVGWAYARNDKMRVVRVVQGASSIAQPGLLRRARPEAWLGSGGLAFPTFDIRGRLHAPGNLRAKAAFYLR